MASLPNYLSDIPNASPEYSLLNSLLEDYFQHTHFKNTIQRKAITKILKRDTDVIVSLPKGHGRTTCFQFPILICQKKVSIVFIGLSSRVNMQINRLNHKDVYVEIIDAETSLEELDHIKKTIQDLSNIKSTLNTILYVTPDAVPTVHFLNLLHYLIETHGLGFIVVDASYCENRWMSDPKKEYSLLRTIRNTYINIPWIVTTEKASFEIASFITTTLSLRTQNPDTPTYSIPWFAMNIEGDNEPLTNYKK